jgi:hypothetical protein
MDSKEILEGNKFIAEFMGKKTEDYKDSGMKDIHGVSILQGSIINANGYNSEISGTGEEGYPLFYCVEFYEGKFGSCIYGDFDLLSSYKTIEVVGHCKDFKEVYESGKWQGNLGSGMLHDEDIQYHKSWDLLMPVFFKIQSWRHDNPLVREVKLGDVVITRFKLMQGGFFLSIAKSLGNKWDMSYISYFFPTEEEFKNAIWEVCVWFVKKVNEKIVQN